MKSFTAIILLILIAVSITPSIGCGSPPLFKVDADYVAVGFGDDKVISVDKNTTEFTKIADEAIRVFQFGGLPAECYFGLSDVESIKINERFVDVGFDQVIEVPTSQNINDLDAEARDKIDKRTTEEGNIISELVSIVCFFSGELDGYVLYRPYEYYAVWYCFISSRGFIKLKRIATALEE